VYWTSNCYYYFIFELKYYFLKNKFDLKKIKLIVGLGNLGKNYERTRHNSGFMFLDLISNSPFKEESKFNSLIADLNTEGSKIILAKPTTMMNESGMAITKLLNYYDLNPYEMALVYDDLDIALGTFKVQFNKYPKVHNGVNDVIEKIGDSFWNIRIGVDTRTDDIKKNMVPNKYLLSRFASTELEILARSMQDLKTYLLDTNENKNPSP